LLQPKQAAQQAASLQQLQARLQQQQQQLQAQQAHQQQVAAAAGPSGSAAAGGAAAAASRPRIPAASNYEGSPTRLDGWLREMQQQFDWYRLTSDADRVSMARAQLRGNALDWWSTLSSATSTTLSTSYDAFQAALRERFQPVNRAQTARIQLDALQQGPRQSLNDYVAAFRRLLEALPDMAEADRLHRFLRGLRPAMQLRLAHQPITTLDGAIKAAAHLDALTGLAILAQGAGPAASGGAGRAHGNPHADMMDLNALGFADVEGLEQETGGDCAGGGGLMDAGPAAAGSSTPLGPSSATTLHREVTELRQLLNAMRDVRRGGSGAPKKNGKGDRERPLPVVDHLSPAQVREYMAAGKCFTCGSTEHRGRDCPHRKASSKQGN
jgi:hypothetical protein